MNTCYYFFISKVANLAVIMYFIAALFSRQFLIPDQDAHATFPNSTIVYSPKPPFNKHTPHMYFPLFTIVEIICYMGWVKVAGSLLNPFGGKLRQFWNLRSIINRNSYPPLLHIFLWYAISLTAISDDTDDFDINYLIDRNLQVNSNSF